MRHQEGADTRKATRAAGQHAFWCKRIERYITNMYSYCMIYYSYIRYIYIYIVILDRLWANFRVPRSL